MTLHDLLEADGILVAPGVYDGGSARLVASAGFPAAYLSGAGVSVAALGQPDIGLLTRDEMLAQLRVVRSVSPLPIIADADTGFGEGTQIVRTAQLYAASGASAMQLEDQVSRKRCGHLRGKELVSRELFAERLYAAKEGAAVGGMLVIARTDAIAVEGFGAAIARAQYYVEHGADLIFVEAPETLEQISAIPREIPVPVVFNLVEAGRTPAMTVPELEELGYALVIAPGTGLRPSLHAMDSAFRLLQREGRLESGATGSPQSLFEMVGLGAWEEIDETLKGYADGLDTD